MDKSLILSKIKKFYEFKTDADFARFIGITPQNLKQWYTRNTYDTHILATFCKEIETEWLLTGEGEMIKFSQPQQPIEDMPTYLKSENKVLQVKIDELNKQLQDINKQLGCLEGKLEGKEEVINILKGELSLLKKDFPTPNVQGARRAAI